MKGAHKDALATEALKESGGPIRGRLPYPSTGGMLHSLGEWLGSPVYRQSMRTLHGPNVPLPRGLERFMRPIDPLKDRLPGHIGRELLYKRPLKETPDVLGEILSQDSY